MQLTKEQLENQNGMNWKKYWCAHCRCTAGKENKPIEFEIIERNIQTGKERIIDRVCESCKSHVKYNEPYYYD